jgi:hypothetical protein
MVTSFCWVACGWPFALSGLDVSLTLLLPPPCRVSSGLGKPVILSDLAARPGPVLRQMLLLPVFLVMASRLSRLPRRKEIRNSSFDNDSSVRVDHHAIAHRLHTTNSHLCLTGHGAQPIKFCTKSSSFQWRARLLGARAPTTAMLIVERGMSRLFQPGNAAGRWSACRWRHAIATQSCRCSRGWMKQVAASGRSVGRIVSRWRLSWVAAGPLWRQSHSANSWAI